MKPEDLQKVLESLGKGGINVNGDFVLNKHTEYEIGNVEKGGIGIQINNGTTAAAKETKEENLATNDKTTLSESRQAILRQLLVLADNGDWVEDIKAEDIKTMLRTVLGVGDISLTAKEMELSATLWNLLEKGRGKDRVKITWQNLVGYFADKMLFNKNGSPSLNEDFFGTKKDYSNIDKGRPSNDKDGDNMPPRFREILPLLDKYVPRLKNASK